MAYDEGLAQRLREQLDGLPAVTEKRMFGGIAFLHHGNMLVGVHKDELIARVGPDATEEALSRPGTRLFDITGRGMRGWVIVGGPTIDEDAVLAGWISDARAFVDSLPPKD
jgi:hypothetical protein